MIGNEISPVDEGSCRVALEVAVQPIDGAGVDDVSVVKGPRVAG